MPDTVFVDNELHKPVLGLKRRLGFRLLEHIDRLMTEPKLWRIYHKKSLGRAPHFQRARVRFKATQGGRGCLTSMLLRWRTYFRRAHGTYLVLFAFFANFIVIRYRLLAEHVPALKPLFSSLTAFAIALFLIYVPSAVLIGRLDCKKFAVPIDSELSAKHPLSAETSPKRRH
jgi:hypothetical protein